jgi:hypothetical protein
MTIRRLSSISLLLRGRACESAAACLRDLPASTYSLSVAKRYHCALKESFGGSTWSSTLPFGLQGLVEMRLSDWHWA